MTGEGFGVLWRKWIYGCLSYSHFSININGYPKGFFSSSRGLRQGDPLSPFLFTLVADSLNQINAESKNMFKGFQVGAEEVNVSHLQFTDDTLIFMDGDPKLGHFLTSLIRCFELVAGLKVNWSKYHILGTTLSNSECAYLANLLG